MTDDMKAQLLNSDLERLNQSFWRNEELGETRVRFFVGLVTAVISALVALATVKRGQNEEFLVPGLDFWALALFALISLLLIGLLTFWRMVRRNCVTDHYKEAMDDIRRQFTHIGLPPYDPIKAKCVSYPAKRGGLADFMAIIIGLIVAALVCVAFIFSDSTCVASCVLAAGSLAVISVVGLILLAHRKRDHFRDSVLTDVYRPTD